MVSLVSQRHGRVVSSLLLVSLFCSTQRQLVSSFSILHSPLLRAQQQQQQQQRHSLLLDLNRRKRIMSSSLYQATSFTTTSTSTTSSTCQALTQRLTDDEMWEEYRTLMKDIMTRDRVIKKAKPEMLTAVQEYLLDRTTLHEEYDMCNLPEDDDDDVKRDNSSKTTTKTAANNNKNAMDQFRAISRKHYAAFCAAKGLTDKAQTQYLERCLGYTADWCAKKRLVLPAAIAWRKLRQTGFVPRENTVSTFLFVFGLLPDDAVATAALNDVATFHDACFEPNEKTVFLRIKALLQSDETQQAEDLLLHAIPQSLQRLRTFTPLLQHYCEQGTTVDGAAHALRLFRHMRNAPGVHLDAETYVLLLSSLAKQGLFTSTVNAGDSTTVGTSTTMMQEAGFPMTGPALLDALATEMGEDLLELNETAAVNLYQSLQSAFAPPKEEAEEKDDEVASLPPATTWASPAGEITMGRVTIDPTTCLCPATKAKLQLFSLTTDQRTMVHETLLQMASTQHEDFAAKMRQRTKHRQVPESSSGAYALEQLSAFVDWVAQRNFTAIIDGPNIAYFGNPVLHYSQVARMVDHLERLGERPLVTMPYKYCQPSFYVATIGKEQTLSKRDLQVIADLKEKDQFFAVPEWCLDDYYWMIGSVVAQVSVTDNDVSLPGLRPLLITNDQMRDHRLDLLEPRLFRRWTSCHVVRYKFGPYDGDEWQADRQVFLEHADSFSREIQGNPINTVNGAAATAWHIPIAEWDEDNHNDRFCISIAVPPSSSSRSR